jgi:hypothetical protein
MHETSILILIAAGCIAAAFVLVVLLVMPLG